MTRAAVMNLGLVAYEEAWDLQRAVAAEVAEGTRPDMILLLEHPPTVTTGRRTEESELHIPGDAEVDVVETDRGGERALELPRLPVRRHPELDHVGGRHASPRVIVPSRMPSKISSQAATGSPSSADTWGGASRAAHVSARTSAPSR